MATTAAQRTLMKKTMALLVTQKEKVHYAQIRPMHTHTIHTFEALKEKLDTAAGITMDCSESVTLICHIAGLRDPNGLNYDGQGFTGTLLEHLKHYHDPAQARTGAMVVFGPYPGKHVCMVHDHGDDPMLFSHGTEADPNLIRFSVMKRFFALEPYTFLSITKLGISG